MKPATPGDRDRTQPELLRADPQALPAGGAAVSAEAWRCPLGGWAHRLTIAPGEEARPFHRWCEQCVQWYRLAELGRADEAPAMTEAQVRAPLEQEIRRAD
jgi:hypothetical protein